MTKKTAVCQTLCLSKKPIKTRVPMRTKYNQHSSYKESTFEKLPRDERGACGRTAAKDQQSACDEQSKDFPQKTFITTFAARGYLKGA